MKADCDIISAKSEFVDSKGRIMKVIGEKFSYHRHKVNMYIAHGTCLHNKILLSDMECFPSGIRSVLIMNFSCDWRM